MTSWRRRCDTVSGNVTCEMMTCALCSSIECRSNVSTRLHINSNECSSGVSSRSSHASSILRCVTTTLVLRTSMSSVHDERLSLYWKAIDFLSRMTAGASAAWLQPRSTRMHRGSEALAASVVAVGVGGSGADVSGSASGTMTS